MDTYQPPKAPEGADRSTSTDYPSVAVELMLADLARSGLTSVHAAVLGLQALSVAPEPFHPVAAYRIGYFDLDGAPTSFYRVRYLATLPGFAGQAQRPQRYAQLPGTLNEVYYPPLLPVSWRTIADDATRTVYITEGEKKAAAGCAAGLPTLGLGGVDVWRAAKRGVPLLPSLREWQWSRRPVVIVFDSDASTKPAVAAAQVRLARQLVALGAVPSILSLPAGPGGSKVGLDDALLGLAGAEAITSLTPIPFEEGAALTEFSEEIIYVRDPGLVVVRATGQKLAPRALAEHAYSDKTFVRIDAKGAARRVKTATEWMQWPGRSTAQRLTYAPGQPQVVGDEWNVWPGWGSTPVSGDVGPWHWLMEYVFNGDAAARRWFEQWCAYSIQHPGTKQYTACVFWATTQGVGKTLIAYTLMRIYGRNAIEIKNKDLNNGFTGWAENKQLVYGDEITGGDSRIDADYLKGLITAESVTVNIKYVPAFTLPNTINYIFTSQHPTAFYVEQGDRRFYIWNMDRPPRPRSEYEAYDKWYRSEAGINALHDYFMRFDLTGFDPKAPALLTKDKEQMRLDSMSDLELWCNDLRHNMERQLAPLGEAAAKGCAVFTPSQILHAFDPEGRGKVKAQRVGHALSAAGFKAANGRAPVYTSLGSVRLIVLRDPEIWLHASPDKLTDHFNSFFGTPKKF